MAGGRPPRAMTSQRCWVLTDGKAGMESQCLGLADALGLTPETKRIVPRFPWKFLPPGLWPRPLAAPGPSGDRLAPPWPDLLIATGRQTVAPSIAIRKASGGATLTVQLQNPTVDPARFDVVIAPAHDGLAGPNVVSTLGALHGVTDERLRGAAETFRKRYAGLSRPLVAVLIGGANRQYRLPPALADRLGTLLAQAARAVGAGLAITPSRRTAPAILRRIVRRLDGVSVDVWDGTGSNPYLGMLGLADAIVVTGDSVNMVSEAAATGKPVHVFALEGRSAKFDAFHEAMAHIGATRPFEGRFEHWSYAPPDDMAKAVAAVGDRLGHRAALRGANPQDD